MMDFKEKIILVMLQFYHNHDMVILLQSQQTNCKELDSGKSVIMMSTNA